MVFGRNEPTIRVKRNLLREKTAGADYPRCRSLLERGKAQSQKLKVREDVHADRSLYSERARSEGGVGGYDSGIHFETVHSGPLPTLNPAGRTDSRSARFNVRWRWRAGSGRSAIALYALCADRAATNDLRTETCEPFRNEETDAARRGADDGLSIESCSLHSDLSIQVR